MCYALYALMLVGLSAIGLRHGGVHGLALGVLLANAAYIALMGRLSHSALPTGVDRPSAWIAGTATLIGLIAAASPPPLGLRILLLVAVLGVLAVTAWRRTTKTPSAPPAGGN
jgi:hypothetical protein